MLSTSVIVWTQFFELYSTLLLNCFYYTWLIFLTRAHQKWIAIFATFIDDEAMISASQVEWDALFNMHRGHRDFRQKVLNRSVIYACWCRCDAFNLLLHYESTLSPFASNYCHSVWCVVHMCSHLTLYQKSMHKAFSICHFILISF